MKKIFLIIILVAVAYLIYKYLPTVWGLYRANAPAKADIANLIPVTGASPKPGQNETNLPLEIPDGYSISIFAKDLTNPRDLVLDSKNTLLVSETSVGKVVALVNGVSETVLGGLNKPHGLAFSGNKLYVAETNQVKVYDYNPEIYKALNGRKIIDLPGGGRHFTRSLLIKGNELYVAIGSSCDACSESDPRRAAIYVSGLNGENFRAYATGLRNSVFMTLNPMNNEIWATNMGRDHLGDNLPPETVNVIKEGANYGWPYCYGNKITDNETNSGNKKFDCSKMQAPLYQFQAHSAPLGLAFLGQDLLVAYHGSWNRSSPTGYKIVKFHEGTPSDFITGWLRSNGDVLGRPVDILVKDNGDEIYVSDDKAGVVYLFKAI